MSFDPMQPTRRHRFVALALAIIAGGVFLVFVARGRLGGAPEPPPRTCAGSPLYDGKTINEARDIYHFTMEKLVEERMDLYAGETPLRCGGETMADVIPAGLTGSLVAALLWSEDPSLRFETPFTYAEFEKLLYELWRTYDCHLFSAGPDTGDIARERVRAGRTFDRLLWTLRASQQYLPLHAGLRCLQRAGTDVRNAMGSCPTRANASLRASRSRKLPS